MTQTDDAPERIAFRRAYMSHAITSGPLMDRPDYVQYVRADLAPDPQDARVNALVEVVLKLASAVDRMHNTVGISWNVRDALIETRAALAAFDKGGKDE